MLWNAGGISPSSGDWEGQGQVRPIGFPGRAFFSARGLAAFLPCPRVGRERQRPRSLVSILIGDSPHTEGPTLRPPPNCRYLLTAPSPSTIPFGDQGLNMCAFEWFVLSVSDPKCLCQYQRQGAFLLCFFSRSFMISVLAFKPVIHFKLIFVGGIR